MRKVLVIALGLAILDAVAGVQPAGAGRICDLQCSPNRAVKKGQLVCLWVCTQVKENNVGSGVTQNIQQKKNIRQN